LASWPPEGKIAGHTQAQGDVKQTDVPVKEAVKRHSHPQDGGEDDGRMPKDHGENEA
jgi:hypothetical protein